MIDIIINPYYTHIITTRHQHCIKAEPIKIFEKTLNFLLTINQSYDTIKTVNRHRAEGEQTITA